MPWQQRLHEQALAFPLDPHHSSASFTVAHLTLSKVSGQIPIIKAEVALGNDNIPTSVTATLDAAKIETQDENRDKDLRADKWFDTDKFPTITFRSVKVTRINATDFTVAGDLTIHGITKPVTLNGVYNGTAKDPYGQTHFGYSAKGTIDRTAFNVGQAPAAIVGNDISIDLEVEALKK